jgi:competence protein ComEC
MRIASSCVVALVMLGGMIAWHEYRVLPDGNTHVRFLTVGQGDSAMVTTPAGATILIDGGPDWSTARELWRFTSLFRRSIDVLILSHANLDHFASFPTLLRYYHVNTLLISGIGDGSEWYRSLLEEAKRSGTSIQTLSAGQRVTIDQLTLTLLWPPQTLGKEYLTDLNNVSLVFRLDDGTHSALFTGDSEERVEKTLVQSGIDLSADLLKVPHHGSLTSSSLDFLKKVHPKDAIISVGKNTYGHPKDAILKRYESLGIRTRRTDQEGTIEYAWSRDTE